LFEGNHDYAGGSSSGTTVPVAEYDHGQGCSVTGGYVYRGSLPEWQGIYLYGDYCSGYEACSTMAGMARSTPVLSGAHLHLGR
jgi:hypothetical protein